jgi:hypothetical protein
MFGAFPSSAKCAKSRPCQIKKNSRYVLSKQVGTEKAKKSSHTTVPSNILTVFPLLIGYLLPDYIAKSDTKELS